MKTLRAVILSEGREAAEVEGPAVVLALIFTNSTVILVSLNQRHELGKMS
jgi:hypothetical protein